MPVNESEDEMDAPHSPFTTTPTNSSRTGKSGAGHGESEAETKSNEDDSDLEHEFNKPPLKLRSYNGWLDYEIQETGP